MKIGILTFHYSINPGSVLQAYCVYQLVREIFPRNEVEIINLVPLNREISNWNFVNLKFPYIKFKSIKKYYKLRKFINNNVKLSNRKYHKDLENQVQYINRQNYDLIVTGSDTVWIHSSKLDGLLPTVYFLPDEIDSKKFSFAASVDPCRDKSPYFNKKNDLKSIFEKYEKITVRDNITRDILHTIGVENVTKIADPTILYDFEKDLNIRVNKSKVIKKRKALVWISCDKVTQKVKCILSELSDIEFVKKDYSTSGDLVKDLNTFSELDIVITDRFHLSIFTLKLTNALLVNIEREDKNPLPLSKGRDLFESIGISSYCIRYESDKEYDFKRNLKNLFIKYNEIEFHNRENLFQAYIESNKLIWKNVSRDIMIIEEKMLHG